MAERSEFLRRWRLPLPLAALLSLALIGQVSLASGQTPTIPAGQSDRAADIFYTHPNADAASMALGKATYEANCAACHERGENRAPLAAMMVFLAPQTIMRALTVGQMRQQATTLSPQQKVSVAEYLTQRKLGGEADVGPRMCAADAQWFDRAAQPPFSGWGLNANGDHAIPTTMAGIDHKNISRLKLKWAFAFPNALKTQSQPAFAGGAIFVGSADGTVYALDRQTGCARWTFSASGPVRGGIVAAPWRASEPGAGPRVYFGDSLGKAYALDAETGKLIWKQTIETHSAASITGTPTLDRGTLYVPVSSLEEASAISPTYPCCTFRGSLVALDSLSGAERWRTFVVDEPRPMGKTSAGVERLGPSGVAIWSSPLVDRARNQVYVTTGDNYTMPASNLSDAVVAIDARTGKINWAYQATEGDGFNSACGAPTRENCPEGAGPDVDFGAGAILAKGTGGKQILLAGQKSGEVYALDPADGSVIWKRKVGRGGALGGVHFGIAQTGNKVFVPISDTFDALEHDGPAKPGVYALDVADGKVAWSAAAADVCNGRRFCEPGYSAAISVTDHLVFAGATDGHVRVFDTTDGRVLWDYYTARPFETVNGTTANGGSMSGGAAPLAYRGMLVVNSGYGMLGKMPGNVMLVFGIDD